MSKNAIQRINKNKKTKNTNLYLSQRDLTQLPLELADCIWVRVLRLNNNWNLSDISLLKGLQNLQELYISDTQVSDLSPLKELKNLQLLSIHSTNVTDLSPLKELKNLQLLSAHSTQISDLSPLTELRNLKELSLYSTQISDLSPLKDLQNLQELYIYSTKVSDLSPILHLIKKGRQVKWHKIIGEIRVENCPLNIPPPELIQQGNEAVLRYFEQIEKEGTDQIFEAKLLIIGEGGAGKTSLCRKLFNPAAELPKEKESTQGIDIQPLYFEASQGKQFRLNIWDFAGQGKYQSAHSFFYTHRSLYVLVDDTRTLDENEAYRTFYHYWLQTAELFGGDSPLLVLHNQKADRARLGFNLGSFQAIFPFVKELFRINLGGEDIAGTLDLKRQIERWAQKLPHIGDVVPKTWTRVREDIEIERQKRPYISDERYREICVMHGITDDEKQSDLSKYFHDLGVFLHFQENSLLRRDVFLQNEWVTNAVYKILDDPEISIKKRGRFDKNDLARIWNKDYYAKRRDELLELMKLFELCYQVQDQEIFVMPQMLPGDIPIYELGMSIPLQIKYEYGFMPKGLLYRLIVRLHRHIAAGQSAVWNGGVVLDRDGGLADIIESIDRRQIAVRATGPRSKELVTIINEEMERLHDTFSERLRVEVKIPCNCVICKNSIMPHFYDKKDLDNRLIKGKSTVECRMSFEDVNVQGLLDGVFTKVVDSKQTTLSQSFTNDYTHIRELIEQGETKKALEVYKKIHPNGAAVLLGNLAELNKQYPMLMEEEFISRKNRINAGLLAMLNV